MMCNRLWSWTVVLLMWFVTASVHAGPGRDLRMAARHGDLETVKLLLEDGVNPNATGKRGGTPLIKAAKGNHIEIVQLLLSYGANPLQRNQKGRSAIDVAERNDHRYIADTLKQTLNEQAVTLAVGPMSHVAFTSLMKAVLQGRGWQIENVDKSKMTAVYMRKRRVYKVEASLHDNHIFIRFLRGYGSKQINYLDNLRNDLSARL